MISNWKFFQQVADRYRNRKTSIHDAAEKSDLVKIEKIYLSSLETNGNRVKKVSPGEHPSLPLDFREPTKTKLISANHYQQYCALKWKLG